MPRLKFSPSKHSMENSQGTNQLDGHGKERPGICRMQQRNYAGSGKLAKWRGTNVDSEL